MDGDENGNTIHEIYHTGLRNQHALEMTAIELTERQVERLEHYPEMAARLRQHHVESQEQARRLEEILERHGTSSSSVKNAVTSVMGNVAAALHVPPSDEILKNTFANYAFEHQEICRIYKPDCHGPEGGGSDLNPGASTVIERRTVNGRVYRQPNCANDNSFYAADRGGPDSWGVRTSGFSSTRDGDLGECAKPWPSPPGSWCASAANCLTDIKQDRPRNKGLAHAAGWKYASDVRLDFLRYYPVTLCIFDLGLA